MQQAHEPRWVHAVYLSNGEEYGKTAAVLAPCIDFAADADDVRHACRQIPRHVLVMGITIGVGHQDADIAAEQFPSRIPEQTFAGSIETLDMPPRVNDDHRVDRGVEQGLQFGLTESRGRLVSVHDKADKRCPRILARDNVGTFRDGGCLRSGHTLQHLQYRPERPCKTPPRSAPDCLRVVLN